MVLRKPYAFLIKNFRLIHIILSVMLIYLLTKTVSIYNFFTDYIANVGIISPEVVDGVFVQAMFTVPFIVIILSVIILGILLMKQKPFALYIVIIATYIVVFAFFNFSLTTARSMELSLVDIRVVKLLRDLLFMIIFVQGILLILMIIRSFGFDIKKFNFGQDLQQLEITETDNEEFEVDVQVESNVVLRHFNKFKRILKYVYFENHLVINIIAIIVVVITVGINLFNSNILTKKGQEGQMFTAYGFSMVIDNSYITNKDYRGITLEEDFALITLDIKVKNNTNKEKAFDTASAALLINDRIYYHTNDYRDRIFDLGNSYNDEKIGSYFERILLVYKVPISQIDEKMTFRYTDKTSIEGKYTLIKLGPKNLDENYKEYVYDLGTTIDLSKSVLKNSSFIINDAEIKKEFKLYYNFYYDNDSYIKSVEYIKPNIETNYNKVLIKINATLSIDEDIDLENVYNVFDFINYFGTLEYKVNGTSKKQNIEFIQVKSNRVNQENVYYLEVLEEVMDATDVVLSLKVRNQIYKYKLN